VKFVFIFIMAVITACGSAYPPCSSAETGQFRCSPDSEQISMCDGEVWMYQYDCSDLTINGEETDMVCVQNGDRAGCSTVDKK
jgi:hypothetical protein